MTFRESDFPALIRHLKSLVEDGTDPVLFREKVAQIVTLYERVPLYPGIAQMCAAQGVKEIDLKDAAPGQRLYLRDGDGGFAGTVTANEGGRVRLDSVSSSKGGSAREVAAGGKAFLVDLKVLEGLWPSLSYPEEPR
jgi:hypothetical protein